MSSWFSLSGFYSSIAQDKSIQSTLATAFNQNNDNGNTNNESMMESLDPQIGNNPLAPSTLNPDSQSPQQLKSQTSSSSSGFQQINSEDSSKPSKDINNNNRINNPLKIEQHQPLTHPTEQPQQQQPQQERQANMADTMDMNEDITQSISDYYYPKRPVATTKRPNLAQINLMSFSGMGENQESFSDLSHAGNNTGAEKQQMKESFSDLQKNDDQGRRGDENQESFSDLRPVVVGWGGQEKVGDLMMADQREEKRENQRDRKSKPTEDEDYGEDDDDNQTNKKNRKTTKNNIDAVECLAMWGIIKDNNKSSHQENNDKGFYDQGFEEIDRNRKNSDSFSEMEFQSNQKDIQLNLQQSIDPQNIQQNIDLSDLSKSIVAPSITPIPIAITASSKPVPPSQSAFFKSPSKPIHPITPTQSQQQKPLAQQPSMQESFYMAAISQQSRTFSTDTNKNPPLQPQKPKPFEHPKPFQIHIKNSIRFIKYGQTQDRLLEERLFQQLTEFFLREGVMLPLLSVRLIEEIQVETSDEQKRLKETLFGDCLNLYFQFLDRKYPELTKRFFSNEEMRKHKSHMSMATKKDESSAIFGQFYKKVFDYLRLSHYSKAQILKRTLQSELAFISEYKQSWLSPSNEEPPSQTSNPPPLQKKHSTITQEKATQKQKYLLRKIAQLQLLISFQKSEMYCEERVNEKVDEAEWRERKGKVVGDRNWFVDKLYGVCYV